MRILVLIGPSGSGKSTVMRALHERGVVSPTPSWTTRPRRLHEGALEVDHRFVHETEFTRREEAGCFIEVVEMFGHRYGMPPVAPPEAGTVAAISVRVAHLSLIARHHPDHVVYGIESTFQAALGRTKSRLTSREEVERRLKNHEVERIDGRTIADRWFDTTDPNGDIIGKIERGISEDFLIKGGPGVRAERA